MNISKQPIYECPACGAMALSDKGEAGIDTGRQFLCSACGARWAGDELERCPECYQWKPREEFEELIICRSAVGFYVCRACYGKIFK